MKEHTKRKPPRERGVEALLDLVDAENLWSDTEGRVYVTVHGGRFHHAHLELGAQGFSDWVRDQAFTRWEQIVPARTVHEFSEHLQAKARMSGPVRTPHVRLAAHEGALYLDLARDDSRAVRISDERYEVIDVPPVPFLRPTGQRPLPEPRESETGLLELLKELFCLRDESSYILLAGWLVDLLRPDGPHHVLSLQGPQGSAKTSTARFLLDLVDPNHAGPGAFPRTEEDLLIMARDGLALALDNQTAITPTQSDRICRVVTGSTITKRRLYTDAGSSVISATASVILTGIGDILTAPDLLDRSLVLHLDRISDEDRRTMSSLEDRFEEVHPEILGHLLRGAVEAVTNYRDLQLPGLPRMADSVKWVAAAMPAWGISSEEYLQAYHAMTAQRIESVVETCPVAQALLGRLAQNPVIEGTATEIFAKLRWGTPKPLRADRDWPTAANHFSRILSELEPILREQFGVVQSKGRTPDRGSRKIIRLERPADAEWVEEWLV